MGANCTLLRKADRLASQVTALKISDNYWFYYEATGHGSEGRAHRPSINYQPNVASDDAQCLGLFGRIPLDVIFIEEFAHGTIGDIQRLPGNILYIVVYDLLLMRCSRLANKIIFKFLERRDN